MHRGVLYARAAMLVAAIVVPTALAARAHAATLTGVACPSATQCTAVDAAGQELTFDPSSSGRHRLGQIVLTQRYHFLDAVACPSARECVAVDRHGSEITFDPRAPGHPHAAEIDSVGFGNGYGVPALTSIACVSSSQCTAVDNQGDFVTFDPFAPRHRDGQTIDTPDDSYTPPPSLRAVVCPSATRCVAVDSYGDALTFAAWGSANDVDTTQMQTNGLKTIACLTTARCVTTDDAQSFDFDTHADFGPNGHTIDRDHRIRALACPSATECTAVDDGGFEVTFDPATKQPGSPVQLSAGGNLDAIACPSPSECVAVGAGGAERDFDPAPSG
jgi:hypothetical protein